MTASLRLRGRVEHAMDRLPSPLLLGTVATSAIALASFGAGATRNRGGVLDALGLNSLAFGHAAGVLGALLWAGIYLLAFSWILLGRRTIFGAGARTEAERTHKVQRTLFAWVTPLLFAAPILSRDVYSYLMQGAMLRDGFDPYTQGAAANPGPMLLEVSHDWRNTTTPYGPLHLWLGEGVTRLVGDNITLGVICYKLVAVAGMAAIAWSIPRIAIRLGSDSAFALWFGVANPIMVLHMVGGMHNESLMVGLVSVGLLLCLYRRFISGVALIAVAVSLKATAAIALPFVVWMATRHLAAAWQASGGAPRPETGRAPALRALPYRYVVGAFFASAIGLAALTIAVIAAITWASGSSWGWLAEISGNSKVINPLSLPSLLAGVTTDTVRIVDDAFSFNAPLTVLRSVFSILMLLGLAVTWWLFKDTDRAAVRGIAVAYAVAFVFNAVSLPWYYASLITLFAVTPAARNTVSWAVGISVVISVAFTGSGNHQLYNVAYMVAAAFAAWALVSLVRPHTAVQPGDTPARAQLA